MGRLLTQVAQRLNGKGGEPASQLQTAFGGVKTHTMLAVYHSPTALASFSPPAWGWSVLAGCAEALETVSD